MKTKTPLFFCAIGGSGMMPLALLAKARGFDVSGSDRGRDQNRTPDRFAFLESQDISLFPQDGSGVTPDVGSLIVSTAVESTVPDYAAAVSHKIPVVHRAQLLAEFFNEARTRIAIAGTSGKSTTTGMTGLILHMARAKPTVVNGAVMKNFATRARPFASFLSGDPDLFVAEVDESDGSISNFNPTVAVLTNVSHDHKSMKELKTLFGAFLNKAGKIVVNLDNQEAASLVPSKNKKQVFSYSLKKKNATLFADNIFLRTTGSSFDITYGDKKTHVVLHVPGTHNISNALAALGAALAVGTDFATATAALESFDGIARRMDVVGEAGGVVVMDDFAHNPDKITATLGALRAFSGRILVLFQPHGYGPMRLMKEEYAKSFASSLNETDQLYLCDPVYMGGTVDKSVGSQDLAALIQKKDRQVIYAAERKDAAIAMMRNAQEGDRIIIMGARDDTLTDLARDLVRQLKLKRRSFP